MMISNVEEGEARKMGNLGELVRRDFRYAAAQGRRHFWVEVDDGGDD